MEVGQKPPLGLGYGAHVLVSDKHSLRRWSEFVSVMVLFTLASGIAIVSPAIAFSSPWLALSVLLLSIVIIPGARDILVAGAGPGVAVVSAILGNNSVVS